MPDAQFEIPALPVLAPLGAALLLGSWLVLRRRRTFTWPRLILVWTACLYLLGVLAVTLLPLQVAVGAYGNQAPWYDRGNFIPLVTIDARTFLLNIVLTIPLGLLLPLLTRARDTGQVVVRALLLSGTVEVVQYATDVLISSGRTADVNDLLANTLGALLGYLVWRWVPIVGRIGARFGSEPPQGWSEPRGGSEPRGASPHTGDTSAHR